MEEEEENEEDKEERNEEVDEDGGDDECVVAVLKRAKVTGQRRSMKVNDDRCHARHFPPRLYRRKGGRREYKDDSQPRS